MGKVNNNAIEALKTREQKFSDSWQDRMFVSKKQITSKAFLDLKTSAACQVFLIFLTKCQWEQKLNSVKGTKIWYVKNNGKIQFSYKKALETWGVSNGRFKKAIDELVRVGLIDIAKSGYGLKKDVSLYAISNRWEKFGTANFVVKKRKKRKQGIGFAKGNSYGKNSGCKTNSTFVDNGYTAVACNG